MRIIALVVLALLTTPVVAMAKGPLSGSVSGPGLAAPIKLDGTGEWDEDSLLALLTADTGIYDRSKHPPRPAGELGPRYDVRLVFPSHSTGNPAYVVRQHLYPYAEHGPTVYTARGRRIFDHTSRTTGGWYRVPRVLIARLDLPAKAVPARATVGRENPARDGPSPLWAIAGVAMLAVVAWRGYDQRRRPLRHPRLRTARAPRRCRPPASRPPTPAAQRSRPATYQRSRRRSRNRKRTRTPHATRHRAPGPSPTPAAATSIRAKSATACASASGSRAERRGTPTRTGPRTPAQRHPATASPLAPVPAPPSPRRRRRRD